jgi:tripartite-type tricarboxylate transporter receptor subunit TctC
MKMSTSRRVAIALLLSVSAIPFLASVAHSQTASFPTKPVRIIVPSPPGGVSDVSARLLGDFLSKRWGQQVLIENRAGAGGNIGMKAAAPSAPDGYTLFSATNSHMTIDPVVTPSLKLHTAFVPLGLVSDNPIVIVANNDLPVKSLRELIDAARVNPGKYGYATAGIASVPHLAAEWIASAAGVRLRHIPFKGGGPSAVAVASGEVPLASVALSAAVPFVKSGKIKPIVVTSASRVAAVPEWPTVADAGFTDIDITVWTGLFAIKGTPPEIVAKLEQDVAAVVSDPAFRERLDVLGGVPGRSFGNAFGQQIVRETANIERIVREANIRID